MARTMFLVTALCAVACIGCSGRDDSNSGQARRPRPEAAPRATADADSAVPSFVTRLLPWLKDDDPNARLETAIGLGRLGEPEAIRPLIEVGASDPNRSIRQAAVEAVALLGGRNVDADETEESVAFLRRVIPALDMDVFRPRDLPEIVARLSDDGGHVHHVNWLALQAAGTLEEVPLKARWRNVTMGEALCRLIVATSPEAGFAIRGGGCLYITTTESIVGRVRGNRREGYRRAAIRRWSSRSEAGKRTLTKLAKEIGQLSFSDVYLGDVVQFLREYSEADIRVDWKALLASGIEPTTYTAADARSITVERAVQLLLEDLGDAAGDGGLDYVVDGEVLFISTRRGVEGRMAAGAGGAPRLIPTRAEEEQQAIDRLIAALEDEDPEVRRSVAKTFNRLPPFLPILRKLLDMEKHNYRPIGPIAS